MSIKCSSNQETVEFDNFGPHNPRKFEYSVVCSAHIDNCGTSVFIKNENPEDQLILCNVFVHLYDLLRGGMTLNQQKLSAVTKCFTPNLP
jgi:phosphate starvation-inducible PhoH-like protein